MSEHDKIILRLYLHNGETVEADVTEEELTEVYKMFTGEKEDLFSSDVCMIGDNEIDMSEVEHIAYKRIEED
jgi:hypothetical protein|nr:MAG TPA: hypothetical protein [Caudoviricetes sp.]